MKKSLILALLAMTMAGSTLAMGKGPAKPPKSPKPITLDIQVFVMGAPEKNRTIQLYINKGTSWDTMLTNLAQKIPARADALTMRTEPKGAPASSKATMGKHAYNLKTNPMPRKEWQKIVANPSAYNIIVKLEAVDLLGKRLEDNKLKAEKEEKTRIENPIEYETIRAKVVELVRTASRYMQEHGKIKALEAFNNINNKTFRYGDLAIFVYDMNGMCIAYGNNPALVGTPSYDLQDEYGTFYVRELIKKAENGGGWVDYKINNSFVSAYVEKRDMGIEPFVIGSFIYSLPK